jgi:hypothetical protein
MSIDGANLGVGAEESLNTVLGGEQPKESDKRTPEQMREYIMSAPESYEEGRKGYGEASLWLARQYLILLDENYEGDLYDEVKKRQGGRDMDFTGFMVGWAENAARYVKRKTEKANPAIVEM